MANICPHCGNDYLIKPKKKESGPILYEFLTFNRECGFNLVKAEDEIAAECISQAMVLDKVEEFDKKIIYRIRKLIKDN